MHLQQDMTSHYLLRAQLRTVSVDVRILLTHSSFRYYMCLAAQSKLAGIRSVRATDDAGWCLPAPETQHVNSRCIADMRCSDAVNASDQLSTQYRGTSIAMALPENLWGGPLHGIVSPVVVKIHLETVDW